MVLVKASLNGARDPAEHPALARTPQDIAGEAIAAVTAGAAALHIHPRDPSGAESLEAGVHAEWLEAVRSAVPGIAVGVTTAAWIEPDPERRLAAVRSWTALPDFASVNFSEQGAVELARALLGNGVGVEAGLADLDDTRVLLASDLVAGCVRVLVEVEGDDAEAAVGMAAAIDAELVDAGVPVPILHHGFEAHTWAVIEAALALGRDVRVGLEDTLTLPDGTTVTGNADLVAAAVMLAHQHGLDVQTLPGA